MLCWAELGWAALWLRGFDATLRLAELGVIWSLAGRGWARLRGLECWRAVLQWAVAEGCVARCCTCAELNVPDQTMTMQSHRSDRCSRHKVTIARAVTVSIGACTCRRVDGIAGEQIVLPESRPCSGRHNGQPNFIISSRSCYTSCVCSIPHVLRRLSTSWDHVAMNGSPNLHMGTVRHKTCSN